MKMIVNLSILSQTCFGLLLLLLVTSCGSVPENRRKADLLAQEVAIAKQKVNEQLTYQTKEYDKVHSEYLEKVRLALTQLSDAMDRKESMEIADSLIGSWKKNGLPGAFQKMLEDRVRANIGRFKEMEAMLVTHQQAYNESLKRQQLSVQELEETRKYLGKIAKPDKAKQAGEALDILVLFGQKAKEINEAQMGGE
ncbi:MAG: hypothetical protein AAF558_14160 [Verrucomicrobiota bacterium]